MIPLGVLASVRAQAAGGINSWAHLRSSAARSSDPTVGTTVTVSDPSEDRYLVAVAAWHPTVATVLGVAVGEAPMEALAVHSVSGVPRSMLCALHLPAGEGTLAVTATGEGSGNIVKALNVYQVHVPGGPVVVDDSYATTAVVTAPEGSLTLGAGISTTQFPVSNLDLTYGASLAGWYVTRGESVQPGEHTWTAGHVSSLFVLAGG